MDFGPSFRADYFWLVLGEQVDCATITFESSSSFSGKQGGKYIFLSEVGELSKINSKH